MEGWTDDGSLLQHISGDKNIIYSNGNDEMTCEPNHTFPHTASKWFTRTQHTFFNHAATGSGTRSALESIPKCLHKSPCACGILKR